MKTVSLLVLVSITQIVTLAKADNMDKYCGEDRRCYTAGTAAAVGTKLGINSAKKYSQSDLFEKQNSHLAYQFDMESPDSLKPNELYNYGQLNGLEDGARVTVTYNLNPVENRAHHIQLNLNQAASDEADANHHRTMSYTAMKTVTTYDSKGQPNGVRIEPDNAQRMHHASQATSYEASARQHEIEADMSRDPNHPVPTYELQEVIGAENDVSKKITLDFLEERTQHTSTVLKVEILNRTAKHELAKMRSKAMTLAGAATLMLTGAAVEAATGAATQKFEELSHKIKINTDTNDFYFNFDSGSSFNSASEFQE